MSRSDFACRILPLVLAVLIALSGCVLVSREGTRSVESPSFNGEARPQRGAPRASDSTKPQGTGLVKPYIPEDRARQEKAKTEIRAEDKAQATPDVTTDAVPSADTVAYAQPADEPERLPKWEEDQKVRVAALDQASGYPNVKKIKICYAVQDDEWWVILYNDIGKAIDLKQFVWNRKTEALEPHLVIEQISKSRLESHLTKTIPGRGCEILDPPSPRRR
jgi:hypothetical protein